MIASVPYFKNAPERFLKELAFRLKPSIFVPNAVVFKEGDHADNMYFVGKGTVKITRGDSDEALALLQDGSFIGESALLNPQPRNATAIALNYCDLYSLSKSDFESILEHDPGFAQHIKNIASQRKP